MAELNASVPSELQIQVALKAILTSATFADANRLKSFLQYIVEETLKGNGPNLRAKIIAADVYGRRPEDGVEQESIVRVDAGRLRRRLDVYYSDEGSRDEVRFQVLAGGYTPTFERVEPVEVIEAAPVPQSNGVMSGHRGSVLAAILASGIAGFGIGWFSNSFAAPAPPTAISIATADADNNDGTLRRSVNQVSSASLLALTFVEEAQTLIFPSIDPVRVQAAEMLCQRAIQFSPEQSTGYSCVAFAQSFLAFITPAGAPKSAMLLRAKDAAATALRIAPADASAQMADAWTSFVDGRRVSALERAKAAIEIAPDEEFLRGFYGMMMTFDGQGPALLASSFPKVKAASAGERYHPFILAGAYFQMGEYAKTIQAIGKAVEIEGRTSALMAGIQVAAYEASGDETSAEFYAANLIASWPRVNYEPILLKFFTDEADALAISARVDSAIARLDAK